MNGADIPVFRTFRILGPWYSCCYKIFRILQNVSIQCMKAIFVNLWKIYEILGRTFICCIFLFILHFLSSIKIFIKMNAPTRIVDSFLIFTVTLLASKLPCPPFAVILLREEEARSSLKRSLRCPNKQACSKQYFLPSFPIVSSRLGLVGRARV